MNVQYRTSAATSSSIHLSLIHSSFRRTSDYTLTHYTLFLICIFCCNIRPCQPAAQFTTQRLDQVPFASHGSLPFTLSNTSSSLLNLGSASTPSSTDRNQSTASFDEPHNGHTFNASSTLASPATRSASSPPLHPDRPLFGATRRDSPLDRSTHSNNRSKSDRWPARSEDVLDYLVIDRKDLFNDRNHIFLNLTQIKLRRDQRNLERKNDSIGLIKLNDTTTSYLNISELYQSWLQDSIEANQHLNDQKTNSLEAGGATESGAQLTTQPSNSLTMIVSMSILYIVIFFTGVFGNLGTCIVILRNKYMRTATNYYLFSLACSDLLLLVLGLPQDLFQLYRPYDYPFSEKICILRGFTSEASSNASVLTITAFTIERYLAICQPLRAHTSLSKLNRVVKLVCLIWLASALFALPLALQFGIKHEVVHLNDNGVGLPSLLCTLTKPITYSFELSTVVFFIIPLCLLTVLYIKIGIHLRRSEKCITRQHVDVNNTQHSQSNLSPNESLLLATINAPPSSPNSNAGPIVVDFSNHQQQKLKQNRSNSGEANVLKSSLIRKMVRSCSNLSLLSSLSLKLNLQSSQLNSQMNLHQINSQPNFQCSPGALNENLRKANSSTNSIKQSADSQLIANNNNNPIDGSVVTIEGESTKGASEESSTRNKLVSRLRNVIEEKDGEELDEEEAERTAMLAKEEEKQSTTAPSAKNVNIANRSIEQLKGESRDASVNSKRKQYQRSPFSTLDSSSSNGWSRMPGLPQRANTTLHSQDSSTSLNIRRRNWRFFKNRTHSTRTIHHSSSSRRAVVKMLVAVVVSFFLCWAPFHIQRIFAILVGQEPTDPQVNLYNLLTNISGITYYLSATINPILYSIMSLKFRTAFKETLHQIWCLKSNSRRRRRAVGAVVAANIHHQAEDSSRGEINVSLTNKNAEPANRSSIESKNQNR